MIPRLTCWFCLVCPLILHSQKLDWMPAVGKKVDSVTLVGEGFVSTGYYERDFALSPSSEEVLFTIQHPRTGYSVIFQTVRREKKWSLPEVAGFSGNYSDLEPFFSADGKRLYFVSNRPRESRPQARDFDIWYVDKMPQGSWGPPVNLGHPVNTDKNEFYPSLSRNGNLYFTAAYDGGTGGEDIWVSKFQDGKYQTPHPLDTAVNSAKDEFNAFIAPDESYILFSSWGRKDEIGRGDLYLSTTDKTGNWQPAYNLGPAINSKHLDYCPFVSPDGRLLYFTSERLPATDLSGRNFSGTSFRKFLDSPANGHGNVYVIRFERAQR